MKKLFLLLTTLTLLSFTGSAQKQTTEKQNINIVLDNWHKAAAEGNFTNYFNAMSDESIFIGTDATENWNKKAFQDFAKPYFDKGKAWDFKPLQRNIYFSNDGKTAWFNELLDTWMKICQGSGVMVKENGVWKIKHYVLSMTVPNDNVDDVVKIKAPIEEELIQKLKR
ncbi:nuclear transport factor 2 family protein [Flavobacterium enshiense]|uniref:nuclear transport factor 2 family protein n=1 Tax=Flavobacterium enshiense TaxID=1341165 RepID=UPI00345D8424